MKKCIVCEKELEEEDSLIGAHKRLLCWEIIYDGIILKSCGNYGSTEYDPMDGVSEYLELALCDKCLVSKGHLIQRVQEVKKKEEALYETVEDFVEYKERIAKGDFVGRGKKKNEDSDPVG